MEVRFMKFYVCEHCGNIIEFVKESGVPVVCCGEKMKELVHAQVIHEKSDPLL